MRHKPQIAFHPLTPARWKDFVQLFGPRGACAGCWCMFWRLRRKDWTRGQGAGNRRAMKRLVDGGARPGLIAYVDGVPAAWCAIAPRADYPVLANSRVLAPIDDAPVWSAPCFFVAKEHRGKQLTAALLEAACSFARERGGRIVEGYPVEPEGDRIAAAFAYTGLAASFRRAQFREVARRSATRPIMRRPVAAERVRGTLRQGASPRG